MKYYSLILVFLFSCLIPVLGQEKNLEEYILLAGDNIFELGNFENANQVFVKQSGDMNTVFIQQNVGVSSNQILTGHYKGNLASITQTGNNHEIKLLQNGNANEAQLNFDGSLTFAEVKQTGNENVINCSINNTGLFEKTAFLIQNGNRNRIDLALFGNEIPTTSQSVKITQEGDGFGAKAFMESYNFPIEITQKAGPGGGEMKVDVSTSYFSFPMK